MELMGGVERKVVMGKEAGREEDGEEELRVEEIKKVIKLTKEGKAIGEDGIPNEVWKYGGEEAESWVVEVYKRIWRGEERDGRNNGRWGNCPHGKKEKRGKSE